MRSEPHLIMIINPPPSLPVLINNKLPSGFVVTLSPVSPEAQYFTLTIWSHTLVQQQFLPFWKKSRKPKLVVFEEVQISASYHLYELILEELQEKLGCELKIIRNLDTSCDFVVL